MDGEQLAGRNFGSVLERRTAEGELVIYKRTNEYEQFRGANMSEPYAWFWIYQWRVDPSV